MAALGWIAVGSAHAQSADPGKAVTSASPAAAVSQPGGLDMDVNPNAPATASSQNQPGGLDMDVNPSAPAPAPTPAPVVASRPAIQAISRDNVQDGARVAPIDPGPLETSPAPGQPGTQPTIAVATPAPPTTTTVTATPAPPTTTIATPAPPTTTTTATPAPATEAPPAKQPEPINIDHPTVIDTADLKAGNTIVSLFGIEGLQGEAAQGLQGFLANESHLTCQAQTSAGFVCLLPDGTDVAEVALVNGAARAKDDAPDPYRDQEAAAQAARRGIWANLPPPPVILKHPMVQDTATLVADGQTYVLNGILGLGAPFAGQLQGYIAANGDSLNCQPQIEPGEYICMMGNGTDIAKVALVNGAARVGPDAPDSYRVQQLDALNNRRGFWQNPPADVLLAVSTVQAVPVCCTYMAGDDGVDGITYVGGVPEAVIDGEPEFLYYGGDAGWGYYDHSHHWHGAPDRFRRHLEHFHPDGHGLRGYGHDAELRRDAVVHREEAGRRDDGPRREAALHPGVARPGGIAEHPGMGGTVHPGVGGTVHPGAGGAAHPDVGGAVHPGVGGPVHPGVGGAPHTTTMAMAGHPGTAGGFMRPSPSTGGFHPGGAPVAHAAPASLGGGGSKKH